ncbi:S-layer homology domain-containing protein [Fusibacter paucivorans]|uniref:S-layer homology domain-containing protein n=1 Tax=Fusibacter paucivorans TaxID=76009 RepID=A0ABS5PMQ9_9FIRM|nr:S-layer homology domain-containing protein [Fusibacter paucivorans]MBS7525871.1 S-layer homology domain-containing protein [Fusibacter paucivorans]
MHKKYDLFLIVLLLILVLQPLSFADNDRVIRSGAELLHDYGIVNGYNGDLMTDKPLTRAEACVLLSELHHEKSAASSAVYQAYFSDVSSTAWYAPYVTYAKSQSWIGGYPDGSFKPEATINAKEWASMMMTLMGYPFSWDNIGNDIAALGINFSGAQFEAFNRGEAFELLWQVLNTNAYGEQVTLGTSLGYFDETVESSDAAILGYMTPSLRMIRLKLDTALTVESVSNARLTVLDDDGVPIDVAKVLYDESTDEILVILAMPRPTYDIVSLEVIGLIEADGTPLKKLTETGIEIIDIVYPRVLGAVAVDAQTLVVHFSEPVQAIDTSSFAFASTAVELESVMLTDESMKAIITITGGQVMPDQIKCFNTIKDDYGHQLITQTVAIASNGIDDSTDETIDSAEEDIIDNNADDTIDGNIGENDESDRTDSESKETDDNVDAETDMDPEVDTETDAETDPDTDPETDESSIPYSTDNESDVNGLFNEPFGN